MTLEPHYSLAEAVARFFPDGPLTVSSLRTEIRKGRLRVARVAGKYLVSESAIRDMLEACQCRVDAKPRASGCGQQDPTAAPSGSSSTDRLRSAQAALQTIFAGPSAH